MLTRSVSLLLLISLCACGGTRKSSHRSYGMMTVSDLIREKGEPLKEQKIPVPNSRILSFQNDENFQVKGEIVMNSFRRPSPEESTLIYWKNFFKDCETREKIIKPLDDSPADIELSCAKKGLSIVYTDGAEFISRVVEYAPE